MDNLIENTIEYVKEFFAKEYTGHDFYHTLRVYNMAKKIAEHEKCNEELVYLGALLHDVDDYKLVGQEDEPFKNAKTYLRSQGVSETRIEQICHIISQVSFKGNDSVVPDTIEGMIVQDADRLDALGAMAIIRTFTFGGSHNRPIHIPELKPRENMSEDEYYKYNGTSINHFYEKVLKLKDLMNTQTAKNIAIHRHKYVEDFLEEFYGEWEGRI